jgi:D-aminopeptidase
MMIGMHAASGTDGFLAHTFTSRIASLRVNGRPMPEAAFFSASLASWGVRPVFFSGCPSACRQAAEAIPGIDTHPIEKSGPSARAGAFDAPAWRRKLAAAAVAALSNRSTVPYRPKGPFSAEVRMRDGAGAARRVGRRWHFQTRGDRIFIRAPDIHRLYMDMIRLSYLTPLAERLLPLGLFLFNARGRLGQAWVRRRLKALGLTR